MNYELNEDEKDRVNRERVALWVEALRSGEYVQGTGALEYRIRHSEYPQKILTTHCCLGVACRVAIANGLDVGARDDNGITEFRASDRPDSVWTSGHMPEKVAEWFGLPVLSPVSTNVILTDDGIQATFANDQERWSFERIADALESRYLS